MEIRYWPYKEVVTGEVAGGPTALQLPNIPAALVKIKALSSNAGTVYIGGTTLVTKADTTTDGNIGDPSAADSQTGFPLAAGHDTDWMPLSNLNLLYRITDNGGDSLVFIVLR